MCLLVTHNFSTRPLTLKLLRVASPQVEISIKVSSVSHKTLLAPTQRQFTTCQAGLRSSRCVVKQAFIQRVRSAAGIGIGQTMKI